MNTRDIRYAGLGYIGIGASDPKAWLKFGTQICGFMPSNIIPGSPSPIRQATPEAHGTGDDGTLYLKMDDRQWRIAVHQSSKPGVRYLGLEIHSHSDFDDAIEAIAQSGGELRTGTPEELSARNVGRLAVIEDPAGHRIELFSGPVRDLDFVSPSGMQFLSGELGMGHVVLYVPDIEAALAFYRDTLGFTRTDYTTFGPNGMGIHFLRCTRRHHSIALLHVGELSGLQHLMVEAASLDNVGESLDRATNAKITITSGLGRHRNDRTVSFYMQGPSGFDVEIGYDSLLIDDGWTENEFAGGGDLWGHHGLDADSLKPRGEE